MLARYQSVTGQNIEAAYWALAAQRNTRILGVFVRLWKRDGKPRYLADTPRFIAYIRHTARRYRELTPLLRLIDEIEGTAADTVSGFAFGRV